MLNDIHAIEQAMAAHGVAVGGRHSDIKDMARGAAFRVRLSAEGAVVAVELIPDAGLGAVWTLRDGQQNGFPGLKTAAGLLALDPAAAEVHRQAWDGAKTPQQRREEILRLLRDSTMDRRQADAWPKAGHRRRIAERSDALKVLAKDPDTAAVPAAFERFLLSIAAAPGFLDMLAARLASAVENKGGEWLEPVRGALLGPATLAIDVKEEEFARDAGDARQVAAIGQALGAGARGGGVDDICALTGLSAELHRGNFPQPNLPGLGQTYLYARNRDNPSLSRYGRTADASFPVGSELVGRLSGAISALTQPEAKGRSWRLIPGETGDKPDLLITSRRDLPLADAIAAEEGDDDDDAIDKRSAWNDLTSKVLRQTNGEKTTDAPLERAVLTVIRTVDPANRKAVYRRTVANEEIWQAVDRWERAVANTPEWLGFFLPVKGEKRTRLRRPPFVKPLSITPLSRILYSNGGTRRVLVIGVTASDAFGLFLRDGDPPQRAARLLHLLVERHGPLLAAVTAARIKGGESLKAFDPRLDLRRDALKSAAWFGVLLYELGRISSKEEDMPDGANYCDDLAFRLGQFLSAADNIHKGYCVDLRGGDFPPTLIGNSVLTIASGDPVRALAILCSRLKPYLAWTSRGDLLSRAKMEEDRGNKGRAIAFRVAFSQSRRANEVAASLHSDLKRSGMGDLKPTDAFRAELLLGYMAGFPPKPKLQGVAPADEAEQDTGEDSQG